TRNMMAQELLENESVSFSIQIEAESSNKLKNDHKFHDVIDEKDDDLLYTDDLKYFHQTFNITGVRLLFVDHSGYMVLILDDRGFMFVWDEMSQDLDYLGNSLREGFTNLIYHLEKICAIMEFTCELIPREELRRQIREKLRDLKF
ncbi:18871_t:CDS:2, partial [Racocetra persica]